MESLRKNRALYIDKEAISSLALVKENLLLPVTTLMNQAEANEVDNSGIYKGKTFPFSFILAPKGKRNEQVLKNIKDGEVLDLICDGIKYGEIITKDVFEIDPIKRVEKIFSTSDTSHPGVKDTLNRLGNYAICGDYWVDFEDIKKGKEKFLEAVKQIEAINITALMLSAKPFHRAHERVIRLALDKSDLIVMFLLKPYKEDMLSYQLRLKTLEFFVDNFLPKSKVVIVPLETTYIFAGNNEVILDSIVAKNFGCNTIMVGQNHAGLGVYYDRHSLKSVFDTLKGIDIKIDIHNEFVYCNLCRTVVSTATCPHGQHHHIHYHSESILELLKQGILPPAVLMRREISAIILSELFPNRFKNLEKLYYDIMPFNGILEKHNEKEFYIELMNLYQTSSLT
jgi:sulfate adenylyltransferase